MEIRNFLDTSIHMNKYIKRVKRRIKKRKRDNCRKVSNTENKSHKGQTFDFKTINCDDCIFHTKKYILEKRKKCNSHN